jgi:hypothetical protein
VGVHIPHKYVFGDVDAGMGLLYNDVDWENFSVTGRVRALGGISAARYLNVFAGVTYNMEFWGNSTRPNLNPDRSGDRMGDDIRSVQWLGFVVGVRI